MAKLERVTAKIFASDAPADKIGQFGSALAGTKLETGDVSTIQALSAYTEGWSSAVISQRNYPVLQETNGVMKNMSYQTAYIMQNGIAEYDPDTEYCTGSLCKGIGNTNQYASWGDENVGNAVTNSDYWKNVTPVNYSNITNCLLEVPQRIKLELNEGVLTLKAGSEVIVPNGFEADGTTPKFDYVTVESDCSWQVSTTDGTRLGFYTGDNNIAGCINPYMYSGDTAKMNSTSAVTYGRFYNTQTNKIYIGNSNGGSWVETQNSLPICIFTNDANGVVTSLNQVFNGIGYIGSTIWVDKGLKLLSSNGFDNDGTSKNLECYVDKLQTITTTNTLAKRLGLYFNQDGSFFGFSQGVYKKYIKSLADRPTGWSGEYWIYVQDENKVYVNQNTTSSNVVMIANMVVTTTGIAELNVDNPFRAVDYSEYIDTIDGEWTYKYLALASSVVLSNTANTTFNLASYLPNDDSVYEVLLSYNGSATAESQYNIDTGFGTVYCFAPIKTNISGCMILPVTSRRTIIIHPTTLTKGTNTYSFRVNAYRKVR